METGPFVIFGSGLVARSLLQTLSACHPTASIYVFTRRADSFADIFPGLKTFRWDLSLPGQQFGLDDGGLRVLASAKVIFMLAGVVNCDADNDVAQMTMLNANCENTVALLEWLTRTCPQLLRTFVLSSTYVSAGSVDNHIHSKVVLERRLGNSTCRKLAVVRCGIIVPAYHFPVQGDYTGTNIFASLIENVLTGRIASLVGDGSSIADIIPVDIVSSVLTALAFESINGRQDFGIKYYVASCSHICPVTWKMISHYIIEYARVRRPSLLQSVLMNVSPENPFVADQRLLSAHPKLAFISNPRKPLAAATRIRNIIPKHMSPDREVSERASVIQAKVSLFLLSPPERLSFETTSDDVQKGLSMIESMGSEAVQTAKRTLIFPNHVNWEEYCHSLVRSVLSRASGVSTLLFDTSSHRTYNCDNSMLNNRTVRKLSYSPIQKIVPDIYFATQNFVDACGETITVKEGLSRNSKYEILHSLSVRKAIRDFSVEQHIDMKKAESEAELILDRIGDSLSTSHLRVLAYFFRKVFGKIYTNINVNNDAPRIVWQAMNGWGTGPGLSIPCPSSTQLHPHPKRTVVLCPSHRSYIDFLSVSYMMYSLGLPVPHICAGEDFLNISGVNHILRLCGAFFMRRTFKGDRLYYEVFKSYVYNLVKDGSFIEFFLEGTRSRYNKCLGPKIGFLKMIVDAFTSGDHDLDDVVFLPISLAYDKLLEADLYVNELMGGAKPPESLNNLVKASTILKNKCGEIHVHIGEPLSLRRLVTDMSLDDPYRKSGASTSSFLPQLAWLLGFKIQQNIIATLSSVLACALLNSFPMNESTGVGIRKGAVALEVASLFQLISDRGGRIAPDSDTGDTILNAVRLLSPHVTIDGDYVRTTLNDYQFLQLYANQIMFHFVEESILHCTFYPYHNAARDREPNQNWSEINSTWNDSSLQLRSLLQLEFPFLSAHHSLTSEEWLQNVKERIGLVTGDFVQVDLSKAHFFRQLLLPFLEAYWLVAIAMNTAEADALSEAAFIRKCQSLAQELLRSGVLAYPQVCILETIRNARAMLSKSEERINAIVLMDPLVERHAHNAIAIESAAKIHFAEANVSSQIDSQKSSKL